MMSNTNWEWRCFDCAAGGEGTEAVVRDESTRHLLLTSHSVTGSEAEEPEPAPKPDHRDWVSIWKKLNRIIKRRSKA